MPEVSCLEICAGAGGQALGLEWAGFTPQALVEIDKACCNTLRFNRPQWNVIEGDLRQFEGTALLQTKPLEIFNCLTNPTIFAVAR
ncbi:DNA cytosine methyltransferase [Oscillatoria sp. FACHB-1406]|uniref:DNA cytosine methyltransferase n=1 Tax=Oscillatoria sp. FACHB-1406 TaxID=2692846 RepID=UPI001683C94E|nr:DNA cytosine methyltransferase [Oscillatoria sp. FACHB-1406]MBD2577074.1 DNA cytosine methyltransferase [Oscillatoria sp. FACHB-1406]